MGGHDDGGFGAVDPVEEFHDADGGLRVEVSGGLVGDQDLGPVDEGPGDGDALLLAAGEFLVESAFFPAEADQFQGLGNELADHARWLADHLQGEGYVLVDGFAG